MRLAGVTFHSDDSHILHPRCLLGSRPRFASVAARQRIAERFTSEANAAQTLSLYERLSAARR